MLFKNKKFFSKYSLKRYPVLFSGVDAPFRGESSVADLMAEYGQPAEKVLSWA